MKQYRPAILVGFIALWAFMLVKCSDQPKQEEQKMSFAAALASAPDSIQIVGKDTIKWYHNTKVNSVTYDVPYAVYVPAGTTPPVDTTTPPVGGTTRNFVIDTIAYTATDFNGPGRGAEQWHSQNTVNIPTEGSNTQRLDVYHRSQLTWSALEPTKGQFNWSILDNLLNAAIDKKQKMSFGIMSVYHDAESQVALYDGARSSYPQWLHQAMQAEGVKDWKKVYGTNSAGWVPNYNSKAYLDGIRARNIALNAHLMNGSYNGVPYRNIINSIDIRDYGNWGEWHNGGIVNNVSEIPAGAHATTASLIQIIKNYTETIPNFQLSVIMTTFDANYLQHTRTSAEVGYFALTTRNAYGPLGWRRDNWGAGDISGDTYIDDLLIDNNRTFNGIALNTLIMKVWQVAPVTGEPYNSSSNDFSDLANQIRKYHGVSFGNGNITFSPNTATKNNFRAASKVAGYRYQINSGSITTGSAANIKLIFKNNGVSPTYENWKLIYELKSGSTVVWTAASSFNPRLIGPGIKTISDAFVNIPTTPGLVLTAKFVDPNGYRDPLTLANIRNADGSYTLTK